MTCCVNCARLERENTELRVLVLALWADLRMRYKLASGDDYAIEPVPALRMLARVLEDAA